MKKLVAALIALSFLSTSGVTFAEEKKDAKTQSAKKADKAAKSTDKDTAAPKKKKKEGC